ncbi:IclR family transcriptional regulator C-terminal domain-containing protein [Streptomyces sp. NPDC096152]|uniref:IclR family transcriptional regulator domain-containing protein n=1 Tax=Streptomyces sp. NPDC096152 TaxID=3366078 RepID=UPI0037F9C855
MAVEGMAGLAKGLAVLEAFGDGAPRLTISDASRATGLSRATARRCLNTLTELGYVTFDGKFFAPTPRVLRIGATYGESASLPQLAQPHLAAIRDAIDESASMAVRYENESLFIARSEGTRLIDNGIRVGARLPLYASSTGQVLLGALDATELADYLAAAPFPARTPETPTTAAAVEDRVRAARAAGMAINCEELALGLLSIAVPVHDPAGQLVAAISVSASSSRVTVDELRDRVAPVMQQHAASLGRQL